MIRVWVKINPPGDRRFESLIPFARLLIWVPIFDPQPYCLLHFESLVKLVERAFAKATPNDFRPVDLALLNDPDKPSHMVSFKGIDRFIDNSLGHSLLNTSLEKQASFIMDQHAKSFRTPIDCVMGLYSF